MISKILKKIPIITNMYYNLCLDILKFSGLNFKKMWLHMKVRPYTMVPSSGLNNAYELSKDVEKKGLKGSFVECGVYNGGCIALMAYIAKKAKSNRKIWLFDSFEGLPEPSKKDGGKAKKFASNKDSGKLKSIGKNVGSINKAKEILRKLNIDDKNVIIRKGWFQHTIPLTKNEIGPIAILRLDGDWYESTKICLENLYDLVISGGYIIIDDYDAWEGCKKAVDEFFDKRSIETKLNKIDQGALFFQKP